MFHFDSGGRKAKKNNVLRQGCGDIVVHQLPVHSSPRFFSCFWSSLDEFFHIPFLHSPHDFLLSKKYRAHIEKNRQIRENILFK